MVRVTPIVAIVIGSLFGSAAVMAQTASTSAAAAAGSKDDWRFHLGQVADRTVADCLELARRDPAGQQADAHRRVTQRHCVRRSPGALSRSRAHRKPA